MKTVTIYTDGACSGNPGPGGWGAILSYKGQEKEISGGEPETTNNRMELTAVIEALSALRQPCAVDLYTDSRYIASAIREGIAPREIVMMHVGKSCGPNIGPGLIAAYYFGTEISDDMARETAIFEKASQAK